MNERRKRALMVLGTLALLIKIFSFFPDAVERYYSNGLYPFIGKWQRIIFGWIPFSIGDIFYAVVTLWLLVKLYVFITALIRKKVDNQRWKTAVLKAAGFLLWVYVLFNLLWGLNYNRIPMSEQMGLSPGHYSVFDLDRVMSELVNKLNALDSSSLIYRKGLETKRILF